MCLSVDQPRAPRKYPSRMTIAECRVELEDQHALFDYEKPRMRKWDFQEAVRVARKAEKKKEEDALRPDATIAPPTPPPRRTARTPASSTATSSKPTTRVPSPEEKTKTSSPSSDEDWVTRMAAGGPEVVKDSSRSRVAANVINADWTNRDRAIRDRVEFSTRLQPAVLHSGGTRASFGTISEVSAVGLADTWVDTLDSNSPCPANYTHVTNRITRNYDYITTFWDTLVWESDGSVIWSMYGKYQAVKLINKLHGVRMLYVSIHLPHKANRGAKEKVYELLNKFIEDNSNDVDVVAVGGDANTRPEVFAAKLPSEYRFAIQPGGPFTTSNNTQPDNLAISDGMLDFDGAVELFKDIPLHHYPFNVPLGFRDTDH
mmetsp:Transcript_14225/g.34228  ORF Transcript_14225/g.34228 Transcript_14225/m.34228 type:complete len:374 (-) Transcript_14225:97-1218(-)